MNVAALLHPGVSPRIIKPFKSSGVVIQIQNNLDDARDCSAALIFGGDGTVHRHLSQLYKRQIPALVIPCGSGNDFAKTIDITGTKAALRAWKQFCAAGDNVTKIDLGLVRAGRREILFCCVAGIGMDSEANARANRMPAWFKRSGGYALAALQSLIAFQPVEMLVTTPQKEIRTEAFFIAIGNAHRYGGGMLVTPRARLDDGLLDICLVRRMHKLKLLCWVPTIFFGGHLRLRQVEYFYAQSVRIAPMRELEVYADGDYACQTPVEIGLLPQALQVIVPHKSLSLCK